MLKITLIKSVKYLLASITIFKKDKISSNKRKSIKKRGNKTVEILAKSKVKIFPSSSLEICLKLKRFEISVLWRTEFFNSWHYNNFYLTKISIYLSANSWTY